MDNLLSAHTFAEGLRLLMWRANLTAIDLAKRTGVSRTAVQAWLAGERYPTQEHLVVVVEELAQALPQDGDGEGQGSRDVRLALMDLLHTEVLRGRA